MVTPMKASRQHGQLAKAYLKHFAKQPQREAKSRAYWRPSDTEQVCDRKLAYIKTGKPYAVPFSAKTDELLAKGKMLESRILHAILPNTGLTLVEEQVSVDVTYEIGKGKTKQDVQHFGYADFLAQDAEKALVLGEVKTTSMYGMKGVVGHMGERDHYSFSYFVQANDYAHDLEVIRGVTIQDILILVYNVNGDEVEESGVPWKDFWFEKDRKLWEAGLKRRAEIQRKLQKGKDNPEVLPRGYQDIGSECLFCNFWPACWSKSERKYADAKSATAAKLVLATLGGAE